MADTECGMAAVAMGLRGKGSGNFFLDPFPLLQNEVCRPRKTIQRAHESHNWPLTEGSMPSTLSNLSILSRILNQPVPRALLKKGKRSATAFADLCEHRLSTQWSSSSRTQPQPQCHDPSHPPTPSSTAPESRRR